MLELMNTISVNMAGPNADAAFSGLARLRPGSQQIQRCNDALPGGALLGFANLVLAHLHDSSGSADFDGVAQRRACAVHLQPSNLQTRPHCWFQQPLLCPKAKYKAVNSQRCTPAAVLSMAAHLLGQNVACCQRCANDLLLRRAAGRREAAGPAVLWVHHDLYPFQQYSQGCIEHPGMQGAWVMISVYKLASKSRWLGT